MGFKQTSQRTHRRRRANLYDLGFAQDYKLVWDFQKKLVDLRLAHEVDDSIIVVEHSHVITLGLNSHKENVLMNNDRLPTFEIERGGDVTYHGPGQLVVYPVISLNEQALGVKQYVVLLEEAIVDALRSFGLKCEGRLGEMTGVWIANTLRKIASVGIATTHWVTYHGFALNVNTDLSYFDMIRPCGFESNIMTSISKELQTKVEMNEVKNSLVSSLSEKFELDLEAIKQSPVIL